MRLSTTSLTAVVVVVVVISSLLFAPCSSATPDDDGRDVDDGEGGDRRTAADIIDNDIDVNIENLDDLSDEVLVIICKSRGFELLHPSSSSSSPTSKTALQNFTHEDYVHAARECLLIEYDMEEAFRANSQLSHEVRMESERMMKRLTTSSAGATITDAVNSTNVTSVDHSRDGAKGGTAMEEKDTNEKGFVALDLVELTREVVAKVKSDIAFVVGIFSPSPKFRSFIVRAWCRLWREIVPTSSPSAIVTITRNAWTTTLDMTRRYMSSFWPAGIVGNRTKTNTNSTDGGDIAKPTTKTNGGEQDDDDEDDDATDI